MRIIKLGRLEFEYCNFNAKKYKSYGVTVNKGDKVFSIHIQFCGPLDREQVLDSFHRAYEFFGLPE